MYFYTGLILIFISLIALAVYIIPAVKNILKRKRDELVAKTEKQADDLFIEKNPRKNMKAFAITGVLIFVIGAFCFKNVVAGIVLGLITASLPLIMMEVAKRKRKKGLEAQLPEIIEKLSGSLRAGSSLMASFENASSRSGGPFADETRLMMKEVSLGLSMEEALSRMSKRIDSEDVSILNTALSIAMRSGGNVSLVLDNIGASIRERRTLDGKIKALTSQGRMQGIIIGLLPVVLLMGIYLIDPEMIKPLFDTTIGRVLLSISVVLEVLGMLFIRKIVNIKY